MERKPILRKFDHITPQHVQFTTEMNFDVQGHVMNTTKKLKCIFCHFFISLVDVTNQIIFMNYLVEHIVAIRTGKILIYCKNLNMELNWLNQQKLIVFFWSNQIMHNIAFQFIFIIFCYIYVWYNDDLDPNKKQLINWIKLNSYLFE